ncbi:unnamed protein product [Ectocarpus sp. 12 AP-2014]
MHIHSVEGSYDNYTIFYSRMARRLGSRGENKIASTWVHPKIKSNVVQHPVSIYIA